MITTIFISKKKLEGWDILYTFFSFPCGAYEDEDLSYNLRSRSKGIFSLIFIFSMAFVVLSTNTEVFNDFGFSLKNSTDFKNVTCTNICSNQYDLKEITFCSEIWKHLPKDQHLIIQTILCLLCGLSILEWILELLFDFMPYKKLYEGTDHITQYSNSEEEDWDLEEILCCFTKE